MPHRSLMHWLLGTHDHSAQHERLDMRVKEAIRSGAEMTTSTAGRLLASSSFEKRKADDLVDSVQKRIASQEARKEKRELDPHINVIIETMWIMRKPPE